jgi:hypothetical protein
MVLADGVGTAEGTSLSAFCYYYKMPETKYLQRKEGYFGSQFWSKGPHTRRWWPSCWQSFKVTQGIIW